MQLARVLGAIGRVCITVGVLILLFVAYQLWGTGLREAQAQRALESEFEEGLADSGLDAADGSTASGGSTTSDGSTASGESASAAPTPAASIGPPPPPPAGGDAMARIRIPDIGVDKIVVEGVTLDDLKQGPGHYPDTPLPGQPGNAAIAGHRTTYGAPFGRVDELDPGDEILVTTVQGSFRYEVSDQLIVSPGAVEVLDDHGDNRLTLTACHPKYSAAQRIIIVASLAGPAAPASDPAAEGTSGDIPDDGRAAGDGEIPDDGQAAGQGDQGTGSPGENAGTVDGGLSGQSAPAWPAIAMGFACACIWLAAWLLGKLWQRWPAYLLCLPLFLLMLFFFFENFSRLLPANF